MERETIELLAGACAVLLFGISLIIWPQVGDHIHDVIDALLSVARAHL